MDVGSMVCLPAVPRAQWQEDSDSRCVFIPMHPAWDLAPWRYMVGAGWIGLKIAPIK